jgi:hypothetical protein
VKQFGDKIDEALLRSFKEADDLVALGLPRAHAKLILSFVHQQLEEYDLDEAAFQAAPLPSVITDLVAQLYAYMRTNPEVWVSVKLRRNGDNDDNHDDVCFEFCARKTHRGRAARLGRWESYCSASGIVDDYRSVPVALDLDKFADHWFFKALGDAIENSDGGERRVARICARHLEPFFDETVAIGGHLEAEFLRLFEAV